MKFIELDVSGRKRLFNTTYITSIDQGSDGTAVITTYTGGESRTWTPKETYTEVKEMLKGSIS